MPIPKQSKLSEYSKGAYFSDSFSRKIKYNNQSAIDVFLEISAQTPAWIEFLMSMRNRIVSKFGLKNLGGLQDISPDKIGSSYAVGERVGIFTLVSISEYEVVLEDCDKHLKVQVSFLLEPQGANAVIYANTVVNTHNFFGKVYMFFVTPFHKIIVPSSLRQLKEST